MILSASLALTIAGSGMASFQDFIDRLLNERIVHVYHADPYLIVALLQGLSPRSPEISTTGMGMPQGQGQWLIPEGRLIVNPTDNSIIYIPKK